MKRKIIYFLTRIIEMLIPEDCTKLPDEVDLHRAILTYHAKYRKNK